MRFIYVTHYTRQHHVRILQMQCAAQECPRCHDSTETLKPIYYLCANPRLCARNVEQSVSVGSCYSVSQVRWIRTNVSIGVIKKKEMSCRQYLCYCCELIGTPVFLRVTQDALVVRMCKYLIHMRYQKLFLP